MNRLKLAVTGAAVALMTILPSALAHAGSASLLINTGGGWVQGSTTPLFSIGQIVPGWSQTQTFEIRSTASSSGALYLGANNIVEVENGCTPDEALVDKTCGPDDGELGHDLSFSVYLDPENDGTFEATPAWTGSLYDIASPLVLSTDMAAGSTWGIRIDASLPRSTGNAAQSDQVGFDFALTLTGEGAGQPSGGGSSAGGPSTGPGTPTTPQGPGSVEVKGIKVIRHPHPSVVHAIINDLPFTGTDAERLVEASLWLLIVGTSLTLLALGRRRRSAAQN